MGKDMLDMRRLRINETTTTTDNHEIRQAATRYYKALFEDYSEENMKGTERIDELCKMQWDLWEYENARPAPRTYNCW